jgi:membrane protease YdiL (CAAX protease family)
VPPTNDAAFTNPGPNAENAFTPPPPPSIPSPLTDPDNPPWGVGTAILVWLASVGFQLLVSVPLLVFYAASRGINPSRVDYQQALATFASTDKMAVFLQILSLLPAHLLTLALIWVIVTRLGKRPFAKIVGLTGDRFPAWMSIAIGAVLFVSGAGIAKLLGGDTTTQLEEIINSSVATRYLVAFIAVATAPLVEELIYRGIVFSALKRAVGAVGAVLFVLGLFTLVHVPQYWPNYGVLLAVGLLSVVLTILRAYTGRLMPCVIIHLVFNGIQALLLVFTAPGKS